MLGAFALVVLVLLFASIPAFDQKLPLAAEFDCVAQLIAGLLVEPPAGTGLGLLIARNLAVAQGGALKFNHSTEDGSEFRVWLPMEVFTSGR